MPFVSQTVRVNGKLRTSHGLGGPSLYCSLRPTAPGCAPPPPPTAQQTADAIRAQQERVQQRLDTARGGRFDFTRPTLPPPPPTADTRRNRFNFSFTRPSLPPRPPIADVTGRPSLPPPPPTYRPPVVQPPPPRTFTDMVSSAVTVPFETVATPPIVPTGSHTAAAAEQTAVEQAAVGGGLPWWVLAGGAAALLFMFSGKGRR